MENKIVIKPMSPDLLRQRRNLMILSALLWFLKYAEVEIKKFSILGIEFSSFGNPRSAYLVLWLLWLYFFFRYYQYFMQEGFFNFKKVFAQVLDNKSIHKIDNIVIKRYPKNIRKDVTFSTLSNWGWEYSGQEEKCPKSDSTYQKLEIFNMGISRWKFIPEILYSLFHVCINKSAFTDYILPILIALFVLFYSSVNWDGSIINSIRLR